MSVSKELWETREQLRHAFLQATIHGMLSTWRRCEFLQTKPQEPDFVAGLVIESTPLIHSALWSVLSPSGVSISMCAVFCHQTPQITFNSSPSASCEVGDLLLAYVHTPRHGTPRRNALLFQAKASAAQPYRVRGTEKDQLRLYTEWPEFTYSRSSFLSRRKRSVTPKAPHSGAQYLLIDDRPFWEPGAGLLGIPGTYPVGCCMPDNFLHDHSDLAAELFNLLIFRTGRPFDDKETAQKGEDWSRMVWDLIESGVRKAFNRKNSGRYQQPRTDRDAVKTLDGVSFTRTTSWACCDTVREVIDPRSTRRLFDEGDDVPPNEVPPDERSDAQEGRAVSVVLIETSERQGEE